MPALTRRHALAVLAAGTTAALSAPALPAAAAPAPAAVPPLGKDFLWGVASAGFQCEGHAPDSNWARYAAGSAHEPYRDSVDFYTHYEDDIALAAGLGVGVYRFSVEWARVQPHPDGWDEAGFAFYDRVLATLARHGIRPMITLDHWVYPGWVADRGGWAGAGMLDAWLANARTVIDRYAGHDPLWVTVNEPTAYLLNEVGNGGLAAADVPVMQEKLIAAHLGAYDHIHAVQPGALVTSNLAYIAGAAEPAVNEPMLDRIAAKLDYVGIDYYYGFSPQSIQQVSTAGFDGLWNLPLQAEGIYYAVRHYARRFPGLPLYIVENGMPTRDEQPRADGYTRGDDLRDTLYWIQRAVADGIDVLGYNYWSLTDNYEWGSYTPRFGLYSVDVRAGGTLTRRPTDAVAAYTGLIHGGGVPAGYRPTRGPVACSLVDTPDSCTDPVTVPS
ncbi:glycoside hydrolase family 1 protein [Nocardia sp. alder85J]|uniref:glycoside hydrolase family 1 protein n=1 Tax=Nocardia sp. alder85J TaxID=2862949 RepID=UPI001CD7EAD5|nr:family 1 glycosylhydrolase [Nocardia sp. alder85J]MCX4091695.1 family 1 glycosylhydrolase [Nocardia sp. alder85J]